MDSHKDLSSSLSENKQENNASSRVLRKLQSAMESGNYYEAHQTYRTLYYRYLTQPSKYEELLQLLFDGSTKLFDRGQTTSACDLALLLTEVLQKTSHPIDEKILNRIESIFERLVRYSIKTSIVENQDDDDDDQEREELKPTTTVDISPDRDQFVANLIKWTTLITPKYKFGHPSLHGRLASTWWRMKNFEQARYHFLLSDDGEGCASFLIEYHLTKGYPSEIDLFIAQAVLQFLCHKNTSTANIVFFKYTQHHPTIVSSSSSSATKSKTTESSIFDDDEKNPPFSMPLLNFLWLLLLCIDTGRVTDYTILIEQYQPSIQRDPSYLDYLDRIGQLFFGLPPPNKKKSNDKGGLMGGAFMRNLMSGLLGGDDAADEGPSSADDENFESVPGTPTQSSATNGASAVTKINKIIAADDTLD